jgi:hypothetical protein
MITSMADIERFVERPAVPACLELFDKNIRTISASANAKDVDVRAYVDIDAVSLSDENRAVAEGVGEAISYHGNRDSDPSLEIDAYKLAVPISPDDNEETIASKLFDIAERFKKQPLTWAPEYNLEQIKQIYCYSADETPSPEEFTDFYYDPATETFHASEELFRKIQAT